MAARKKVQNKDIDTYDKLSWKTILIYIVLVAFSIIIISPLVIVFSSSLRIPANQTNPLSLFTQFSLESYKQAFHNMNYPMELFNSIITTGGSVLIIVVISTMAAYPISRIKSKRSRMLYYLFIGGLIVPSQMVIVPIAQMFGRLGIANSRFTPMIMFITCSLPFSIFLFTGFLKSVPVEVEEAAYIDGTGLWKRYSSIVFPLLKPATVSVVITQGLWIWNDYFYPMVFVSKSNQFTLPVGMIQFLGDKENPAQWNVLFASCVLCALPLVILFTVLQKQFVNGIAAGAVKG